MKRFIIFIAIFTALIIVIVTVKTVQRRTTLLTPQLSTTYVTVLADGPAVSKWAPTEDMFIGYYAGAALVYNRAGILMGRFLETNSFSWSPNGRYIAGTTESLKQVFVAKPDGTDYRILASSSAYIEEIEWTSPDAIFISYQEEHSAVNMIGLISTKDGSIRKISEGAKISSGLNGNVLFVRGTTKNEIDEIVTVDSNGSGLTVLTTIPHADVNGVYGVTWGPLLSPNGRWLASVGVDPQNKNDSWLNIVDLKQTNGSVRHLIKMSEVPFAWSPDSQEIAVTVAGSNKRGALVIVKVSNGSAKILAMPDSDWCLIWQPAWSTNGLLVSYGCRSAQGEPTDDPSSLRFYQYSKTIK